MPTTAGSIKSCPMQVPATATVERNDATAMGQKSLGVPSLLKFYHISLTPLLKPSEI